MFLGCIPMYAVFFLSIGILFKSMIILVEELENQVTIKTSCHNDLHAIISLTKFDNPILNYFTAVS